MSPRTISVSVYAVVSLGTQLLAEGESHPDQLQRSTTCSEPKNSHPLEVTPTPGLVLLLVARWAKRTWGPTSRGNFSRQLFPEGGKGAAQDLNPLLPPATAYPAQYPLVTFTSSGDLAQPHTTSSQDPGTFISYACSV